ncbi:hypothetical protein L1987_37967 [Smallanthus sonchifolius]|uniref:Uncharacterized protein n=1 Tax=Smallanthus sonchifolius TaxID=185202 RepID=A0ACB9HJ43_9ASTR|nr:hypothetical protein L1987_37967 [Smallanthus sonchifolius]
MMVATAATIDSAGDGNMKWYQSRNRKAQVEKDSEMSCDSFHQLAEAIGRFTEVYKRVEEGKQRQMVELKKQIMHFTKDLEIERMKLLMKSQVQFGKWKRLKIN